MAEMNVREKVANSLLVFINLFKDKLDEAAYRIILSRKEIAGHSAICEDRISKQLSDFKKEKIITINNKGIQIDQKALQKIITPYVFA
ncbi:MAG: helix-turn-helix domain-containing protein [Bacteroidetes bacterium]|nr:helix-turn-helix domain-containing protein [Bacteroidota bacterium]